MKNVKLVDFAIGTTEMVLDSTTKNIEMTSSQQIYFFILYESGLQESGLSGSKS